MTMTSVVFLIYLKVAEGVACSLRKDGAPTDCSGVIPDFVIAICCGIAIAGVIGAGYRYYRDFVLGEYDRDVKP